MLKAAEAMSKGNKKRAALNGSLYFSGTKALGADMKSARFSSAYVYLDALNVDEPAASRMAVGMADGVPCYGAASAAVTVL